MTRRQPAAVAVLTRRPPRPALPPLPEAAVAAGERALDVAAEARWAVTERRPARALAGTVGFLLAAAFCSALAVTPAAPRSGAVLLAVVAAVASARGVEAGAVAGFAAGLAADIPLATPLGLRALAFTLVGAALGRSTISPRDPARRRSAVTRAAVAASAGTVLAAVGAALLGAVSPPAGEVGRQAALDAALAGLIGPALFSSDLCWARRRLPRRSPTQIGVR